MPRIRAIKPDFFKDEDLATLPFEARFLYTGLWCLSDREGRLEDRPKYIKAEIFPYDKISVEKLLTLLSKPNIKDRPSKIFIRRYTVNDRNYIDIPEFLRHQKPHNTEKESLIPLFNGYITVRQQTSESENEVHSPVNGVLLSVNGLMGKGNGNGSASDAIVVLKFLNEKAGKNFRCVDGAMAFIEARLRDGATVDDCKAIIAIKCREAKEGKFGREYLRPETLFNKTKFESYYGQIGSFGRDEK